MGDKQRLIIEFEGSEEKMQELLAKLEEMADKDEGVEIKAVTIRKD